MILPAPGADEPIRNTSAVSEHLNDATIVFPRIAYRFYESVPNLLTGFGILGTFIGLAAGVGAAGAGLASGDPERITASLQRLLAGASLAFVTSIVGILSSMVFVCFERWTLRRLRLALKAWVDALESSIERVTPERIALDQLRQAERAARQLEQFNTELVFSIQQALEERIANRLSPQLERLLEAVERLREDRSTDSGRMIEQALATFADTLRARTGAEFDAMSATVDGLNRTLTESADRFAATQRDIHGALGEVVEAVTTQAASSTRAMTETLEAALAGVTASVTGAGDRMVERMAASSQAATADVRQTVTAAARDMAAAGAGAVSTIAGSLEGLQGAAERLERSTVQSERVAVRHEPVRRPARDGAGHHRVDPPADGRHRGAAGAHRRRHPRLGRPNRRGPGADGGGGRPHPARCGRRWAATSRKWPARGRTTGIASSRSTVRWRRSSPDSRPACRTIPARSRSS